MEDFFCSLVNTFNMSVLERVGNKKYKYLGMRSDFYDRIFPPETSDTPCETPWEYSLMLDFFIADVEKYFSSSEPGKISSGIWQEEAGDDKYLLNAYALHIENKEILVIRNVTDEFASYVGMLQKARENLLLQNKLTKTLDLYRQRLNQTALTSIYNADTFTDMVKSQLDKGDYNGFSMAFLIVDVDNLREINKYYGRSKGDEVLAKIGEIFLGTLRNDDIIARYGGDEFIILAYNTAAVQARKLAEKINRTISGYDFGIPMTVTVSIGGKIYPGTGNVEECIKEADFALYEAQAVGPGSVNIK